MRGFRLPFQALAVRDERGAAAVAVFGQVRPRRGTQTVELQRQGPDGSWATVPSQPVAGARGRPCGAFATDGQGLYRRIVADQGPGRYRARWLGARRARRRSARRRRSGGRCALAGGAAAALTRLGDDGTPAG